MNYLNNKLKTSVTSLISRLMSRRNLDMHLTLVSLLDLPVSAALSVIKKNAASFGSQFLRIMSLTNAALVICNNHKQSEYLATCSVLKKEAIWGYVLSKYGVSRFVYCLDE